MNIPKGWNLHGKRLKIGVPVNPGFSELISVIRDPQTNETTVDGFCAEVFREAIKSLDYELQYEFVPFVDANGQLAGTYDDLIREVYHKISIRRMQFPSPEEYADALRKGSKNGGVSAIIDEMPYLKVFLAKYPADYTVIKSKATSGGFGFVFPKGSPLVQDMSSAIVRLREEEKLQMMLNKWFNHDESIFTSHGMSSTSALLVCLYQKRQAMGISNFKFYLSCTIGSVNTLIKRVIVRQENTDGPLK
ncbi:hypothetical protein V6N13_002663 [Hibiscus sabdariffa]